MGTNVLFITVDQWRGDCLSALGHPVVETPALDGLAATGVLFANHWANAAPCGPSARRLYTGTYLHHHRSILNGTPLDARFTNVALVARQLGYDPVLFGYTDTSVDPRGRCQPMIRASFSYEGVLPGFRPELLDPWEQGEPGVGPLAGRRGVDVPANPHDLYLPEEGYPGADAHGSTWAPATVFGRGDSQSAFVVEQVGRGSRATATARSSSTPRSSGPIRRAATPERCTTTSTTRTPARRSSARAPRDEEAALILDSGASTWKGCPRRPSPRSTSPAASHLLRRHRARSTTSWPALRLPGPWASGTPPSSCSPATTARWGATTG